MLPGDREEANSIISSGDLVWLVEEPEVNCIPSCRKSKWNDSQNQGGLKINSLAVSFIGEETNCKRESNDEWNSEENAYKDVPPVNLIIEELVENLDELSSRDQDDQQSNCLNATIDWEDHAALHVFSLNRLALANAAAAHCGSFVNS